MKHTKLGVNPSIKSTIYIIIGWIIIYSLCYFVWNQGLKVFLYSIVLALGFICVCRSLCRIKHYWGTLKSNTRIKVYNLCLTSIGIYSILLVGCAKYYLDFIYGGFVVIAAAVSISIINNEIDHYFPEKKNNNEKDNINIIISRQDIYDAKGNKFIIPKQHIKAIKHSK